MKRSLINPAVLSGVAAITVSLASAAWAGSIIGVNVNGSPIQFSGTGPAEIQGSVLVPLRGVFEALGATVDYDSATRTITANKGTTDIVLQVASTIASVNGQTEMLSQPARTIGGSTMVPLRFVAQALGEEVDWDAPSNTVEIRTPEQHLATLPQPTGSAETVGRVTGIFTDTDPPQITVRVDGQNTAIPISSQTIVLRSEPGRAATQVPLSQIKIGDQVTVERDDNGVAQSITASYGQVRGTVKSIGMLANGDHVITLNDGVTVEIAPDAPVTMDGNPIAISDIMSDERVVVRTNPDNSIGYGVALATGGAQNPTPPANTDLPTDNSGAIQVTSFSDDATRAMRSGDVLTATLRGTPDGQAYFSVPGVVDSVPMVETSPGVYTGTYRVPRNVTVTGATVLGKLERNGATSPLIQADGTVTVDSADPKVTEVSPRDGATVDSDRPEIYGTLSDAGGAGISPDDSRLEVDGVDVTQQATVTPVFFSYRPSTSLGSGPHRARVTIVDAAGNRSSAEWTFTVASERRVRSFSSDAISGSALTEGSTVRFTLEAEPGGRATVTIGELIRDIPLQESSPGVYTGRYTVSHGDSARNAPVTATFISRDGVAVSTNLSTGLEIAAGVPDAPRIISPKDGDTVSDPMTVEGRCAPNATVLVKVDYVSKQLGGLFAINGSAGSQEVRADDRGHWTSDTFSLSSNSLFGNDRDTLFTISATVENSSGDDSDPSKISVKKG